VKRKSAVVTGGCGFIGVHCVQRLLEDGYRVLCIDNLSRLGSRSNLAWISAHPLASSLSCDQIDIRSFNDFERVLREHIHSHGTPEVVIHEAAQVAVTESMDRPRIDFETNAVGTLNVLEALRANCPNAAVIFPSTNKVYGTLENVEISERTDRYEFRTLKTGIPCSYPLNPHTPYACSKAAADCYVHDYSRVYGLRTFVFRQSCVYGTRQFGEENQGWISWLAIATALRKDINIYGNGKQLRDVLWIDDLLDAYWMAWHSGLSGQVFNIGGGPENTLSILELINLLKEVDSKGELECRFRTHPSRPGDQLVYVSDISELAEKLTWKPKVSPRQGVARLWDWIRSNSGMISRYFEPQSATRLEPYGVRRVSLGRYGFYLTP
jgi:CDP-paratose 2-epimerase